MDIKPNWTVLLIKPTAKEKVHKGVSKWHFTEWQLKG